MAAIYDLILKGGTVVNHDGVGGRDVGVRDGGVRGGEVLRGAHGTHLKVMRWQKVRRCACRWSPAPIPDTRSRRWNCACGCKPPVFKLSVMFPPGGHPNCPTYGHPNCSTWPG